MNCPRTLEVEAARDGRLADRGSLDLHLRTCITCRARAEQIERIAHALRQVPVSPDDELASQRASGRLLSAFDASLLASHRRTAPRAAWLSAIAAGVAAVVYLVTTRTHPTAVPPPVAADPIEVISDHARWSRIDTGAATTVQLDDGEVRIRVEHSGRPRKLVVIVPDGQIEDLGTTFVVRVQDGRTAEISVNEGSVVFRHGGDVPLVLAAGSRWRADELAATGAPLSVPRPRAKATKMTAHPPANGAAGAGPGLERELRDAVAALDAGDSAAAAALLRGIVARYPHDAGAEDAAYLLVLALQRASDLDAARDAARDYLRRFPHGFRRTAVEPIAR